MSMLILVALATMALLFTIAGKITGKASTGFTGFKMFCFPLSVKGKITSRYGERIDPHTKEIKFHNGIDISATEGTKVLSISEGTVIRVWSDKTNGYAMRVKHTNNYTSGYAHLSRQLKGKGTKVKKGETIALSGSTGKSTGGHLHLTLYNPEGNTVDPEKFINT